MAHCFPPWNPLSLCGVVVSFLATPPYAPGRPCSQPPSQGIFGSINETHTYICLFLICCLGQCLGTSNLLPVTLGPIGEVASSHIPEIPHMAGWLYLLQLLCPSISHCSIAIFLSTPLCVLHQAMVGILPCLPLPSH